MSRLRFLNGNTLKIIAAICMVIDHVGLMFFPYNSIFRIIGRLSFPIFAFMISEGAKYTKNRAKYFLMLFSLAAVCQTVYYFFGNSLYMSVLVTFSISLPVIFSMQEFKRALFDCGASVTKKIISTIILIASVAFVIVINHYLDIDYGACGCLLPAFASIFDFRGIDVPDRYRRLDVLPLRVVTFTFGMILLVADLYDPTVAVRNAQPFMLLAAPLLLMYSGQRGKYKMKYFFYIFYPVHLVVLEGIYILVYYILK